MRGFLDASMLRRAMSLYAEALREHRDELNSLNVYPVPDGDTGTNMLLTQEAVVAALDASTAGQSPPDLAATIARASLMGARGNSGVILSQVLRGLVEGMPTDGVFAPPDLAAALRRAADEARRAVARPVEGTILTVMRDAAGAAAVGEKKGCQEVLRAALEEARASLARTTEQLPELRRAGVVDAGGKGIVLLLASLLAAVTGEEPSEPVGPTGPVGASDAESPPADLEFAYEVQYLLEAPDEEIGPLRAALGQLGDSLVIVGGGGLFNVHVHTNQPGRAVGLGHLAGSQRDVAIVSLEDRVAECLSGQARAVQVAEQACALVAVTEGEGLARAFRSLGAVVVTGGPGNDPAVSDLVAAVEAAPAGVVLLLPNYSDIVPAAERAAVESTRDAWVVAATSIPAGLAAATEFNPLVALDRNVQAMGRAVERSRAGRLSRAERDAPTPAGEVHRGEWLGMAGDDVVAVGGSAADCAVAVAQHLAGDGGEVLTVISGADAAAEDRAAVEAALRACFPQLSFEMLDGGQPRSAFIIGVE